MSTVRTGGTTAAGVEAWRLLFGFFWTLEDYWGSCSRKLGLPKMQAYALMLLDEPMPMNQLAAKCDCDPSTLTGVVDRLEARGYVERRPSPVDRRVKLLAVTDAGASVRERVFDVAYEPHPAFAALSAADQRALRDILRRALAPDA
jgi:MarR family transcriptional regulator, organic hydroperoxide resistance regulator